jgi:hypothetical protein
MVQYITQPITQPPFVVVGKFVTKRNVFILFSVDEDYVFFDSISTGVVLVGIKLLIHVLFLNFQKHKQCTTKTNIQMDISKKKDVSYNQI